jgi:hypothetical protein
MEEMEHLIATWIVSVWQRRQLGEYAPSWDPGGIHSPNSLFAASFAQAGFAMEIPSPELFYELLPVHYISNISRRGVQIRGLWYDGTALKDYRGTRSGTGRQAQGGVGRSPRSPGPAQRIFPGPDHSRLARPGLDGHAAGRADARLR